MMFILLLAIAQAAPGASEPRSTTFTDRVDAFDAVERKVGPVPSSTLGVEFTVSSKGFTRTEIPASTTLSWPEPLTQAISGGTGKHDVDLNIELAARVVFDYWILRGSYDVWVHSIRMSGAAATQGLLLPGSPMPSVKVERSGAVLASRAVEIDLGGGFYLQFEADAIPRMSSRFTGLRVETGDAMITTHGERALHPIPEVGRSGIDLRHTYVGELHTTLDLLLRPRLALCDDYFGCFLTVARFDVPVALVDEFQIRSFGKDNLYFPLPVATLRRAGHAFGAVEVGDEARHVIEVRNDGDLALAVDVEVDGGASFDAVPPRLTIPPRGVGQVEVFYAPREEGEHLGHVALLSNDPATPELLFVVSGAGVVTPEPEPEPGDPGGGGGGSNLVDDGDVRQIGECGCASAPSGAAVALPLLLAVTTLLRRRRLVDVRSRTA